MFSSPARSAHFLVGANVLSFISLSWLMFHLQLPVTMFRFDGTFLASVALNQAHWMGSAHAFAFNPLEGNAGMWFPTAMGLIPGFAVARWAIDASALPAVATTWFAAEFLLSSLVVGKILGLDWRGCILGAWAVALGMLPYWVPTPGMERIWGNPHFLTAIAASVLAIVSIYRIGQHRSIAAFSGLTLAAFSLQSYVAFSQPLTTVLAWPVFALFTFFAVVTAPGWRERRLKLLALAIVYLLLYLIFADYLKGLFLNSKPVIFWSELVPAGGGFRQQSFWLEHSSRWYGLVIWVTAILSALWCCRDRNPLAKGAAFAFLMLVLGSLVIAEFIGRSGIVWRGPVLAYFDLFALPMYAYFVGRAVSDVVGHGLRIGQQIPLASAAVVPWCALLAWSPPYDRPAIRGEVPFPWPPAKSELVTYLSKRVSLNDSRQFRGRVASTAGSDWERQYRHVPFVSQHNYDGMVSWHTGNDHRMYGFWYYGIPTLIEMTQFSSPFFHAVSSRLLAPPDILHTRPQTTITRPDERVLAQWGVRFLLQDHPPTHGKAAFVQAIGSGHNQWLVEIPHPNLAGVTPTHVDVVGTVGDALRVIARPSFDFTEAVVLFAPLPERANLVSGTAGGIQFLPIGVEIAARSEGTSLLVLPLEFSRCLQNHLRDSSGILPKIFRANVSQTAVLFQGSLSGRLSLAVSPLEGSGCRRGDYDEAVALKAGDAPRDPLR